ncbi:MAG: HNH endonuclease [Spirulina sp. SIO3F2]|nr:HNH endonuclease [Spirulina sp. SIO3F2]
MTKRKKISRSIRELVAQRAKYRCEYCQCPEDFAIQAFTIEHILPRYAGGDDEISNLAWACFGCNSAKHVKVKATDPQTGKLVVLFHPRQQQWHQHFDWNPDSTVVVGKTQCGRATIEALQINRKGVVNLRRLLVKANRHPPKD